MTDIIEKSEITKDVVKQSDIDLLINRLDKLESDLKKHLDKYERDSKTFVKGLV